MAQNIVQTEIKKFTNTICESPAIKDYTEVFEFIDNTYATNPDLILNVYTQLVIHFAIGKPDCEEEILSYMYDVTDGGCIDAEVLHDIHIYAESNARGILEHFCPLIYFSSDSIHYGL